MAPHTKEERLALINENLEEVLDPQIIEEVLDSGRNPKIYWGTILSPFFFSFFVLDVFRVTFFSSLFFLQRHNAYWNINR